MRVSPSIEIRKSEMNVPTGNKLVYISQIFKTTMGIGLPPALMAGNVVVREANSPQLWPGAVLLIEGPLGFGMELSNAFETRYGVPADHIKVIGKKAVDFNPDFQAKVSIEYFPKPPGAELIFVEFTVKDVAESFEVEFEVSPDRQYITEVSAEMNRLKMKLKEQAFGGRVRNIKVATKPGGSISWDRDVSTKIQTEIKLKIKAALEADVKVGGATVKVELYGSLFKKFQEDGVIKNGIEAGLVLTFPF